MGQGLPAKPATTFLEHGSGLAPVNLDANCQFLLKNMPIYLIGGLKIGIKAFATKASTLGFLIIERSLINDQRAQNRNKIY